MTRRLAIIFLILLVSYCTSSLGFSFNGSPHDQSFAYSKQQLQNRIDQLKREAKATITQETPTLFQGIAYHQNSQEAYREYHFQISPYNVLVIYREPDGTLFAIKSLNFNNRSNPQAPNLSSTPDVEQINLRNGEYFSSVFIKEGQHYHLHYRERFDDSIRYEVLAQNNSGDPLVIDAGFDRLIYQQWQLLIKNEGTFDYLLLPQQDKFRLKIANTECMLTDHTCFRVVVDNWLLAMLSQPLNLEYDSQKRLRGFEGKSNISDKLGNYPRVTITYQHN